MAYLACMTILLTIAQKWAGMDPVRIENGPSWFWALVSALYTMVLFVLAIILKANDHPQLSAFVGSFAFGSAIGACFLTRFKRVPRGVQSCMARWWIERKNAFVDSAIKSLIVISIGLLVWFVALPLNGRYWSAVCLALSLAIFKAGKAITKIRPGVLRLTPLLARHYEIVDLSWKDRNKIRDELWELRYRKEKLWKNNKRAVADFELYVARRRMLIRGNILLTMFVGVLGLVGWLQMASPIMATWDAIHLRDDITAAFGLFAGVGLHFR